MVPEARWMRGWAFMTVRTCAVPSPEGLPSSNRFLVRLHQTSAAQPTPMPRTVKAKTPRRDSRTLAAVQSRCACAGTVYGAGAPGFPPCSILSLSAARTSLP